MPDISALWHTAHVRLAGLPRPIELICATSFDPEAYDSEKYRCRERLMHGTRLADPCALRLTT